MKKILVLLLFSITLFSCSSSKRELSESILSQVEVAEKEMFAATSAGDSATFRKLSGTDYFTINANGKAQTLQEALPFIPRFKGSTVELLNQQQRVYGNLVLRTGLLKASINGQLVAEALYTAGWVYRDNRWQFIHWQGTPTGILLEGKGMIEPPKN